MCEVANEAGGAGGGKGERIAPEIPLEGYNGEGVHASPDHGEGGLSTRESRVEETDARDHD